MNHVPSTLLSSGAQPLSRRLLAKMRTRQALVAAAKALFTEHGYEQATVREIARATGMSTGAVFANFTDKADLFAEVLSVDHETLNPALREVASEDRSAGDALAAVYARAYAFHLAQLPLFQAAQAFSWHDVRRKNRAQEEVALGFAVDILRRAVSRGELRPGLDVELAADLIQQAYVANYRFAVRDGMGIEGLTERLKRQIALILAA